LKILPVTRFKDLKAAILTLKMLTEAACDSVKIPRKPPVTNLFLRIFPAATERSALENDDQSGLQQVFSK
jgi:hypothetical protein